MVQLLSELLLVGSNGSIRFFIGRVRLWSRKTARTRASSVYAMNIWMSVLRQKDYTKWSPEGYFLWEFQIFSEKAKFSDKSKVDELQPTFRFSWVIKNWTKLIPPNVGSSNEYFDYSHFLLFDIFIFIYFSSQERNSHF